MCCVVYLKKNKNSIEQVTIKIYIFITNLLQPEFDKVEAAAALNVQKVGSSQPEC